MKERTWSAIFVTLMIISLIGVISSAYGTYQGYISDDEKINEIINEISDANLTVLNADFESPAIIIETKNITELILHAKELNHTEIYKVQGYGYVVIDDYGVYA